MPQLIVYDSLCGNMHHMKHTPALFRLPHISPTLIVGGSIPCARCINAEIRGPWDVHPALQRASNWGRGGGGWRGINNMGWVICNMQLNIFMQSLIHSPTVRIACTP